MGSPYPDPDSVISVEGGAKSLGLRACHLKGEVEGSEAPGRGDLADPLHMVDSNPDSLEGA
jgi:hypothetical protein